jgi:formylglycine-generating enzyme required for sulfatase activity
VPTGTLIAYATRPNKTALDGAVGGRNSPYVKYLKQELPKPGLSILKVLTNVRVAVMKETDNRQAPGFYSELDREFCFVEPCGQVVAVPVSPPTPVLNSQEQIAATLADLEKQKAALKLQEEKLKQQANAEKISRLLLKCKAHFETSRLTTGIGDSTLACYREVLEFEPGNEKALEGLEEIENSYVAWIEDATRRNQEVEVNRYLASLRLVNPDSPYLAQFDGGKVFRDSLKDGSLGPEMVWVAAGSFKIGDIQGGGDSDEKHVHDVSVGRFAMGRYEVTFAEYDKFADATGRKKPGDNGWGRGNRPVIDVSWYDATAYAEWLSQQTGQKYRLPTEAEWEYAARAGTETKYWWGNTASHEYANYGTDSCCDGLAKGKDRWKYTAPVGSFDANQFGLHDTVGNVWEWTCSKYESKYNGEEKRCTSKTNGSHRVLRGGSWNINSGNVRVANRDTVSGYYRNVDVGFRLTRLLITI